MRSFREISEAPGDTAVFTFGRFNPPTTGHEKLIDALARESKKVSGSKMYVFASHSQDPKKNPLPYPKKIAYMKKMFPKYKSNITTAKQRNVFEVATFLHDKGHRAVVMVVGSDRVDEFDRLLNQYNGVKGRHGYYGFDNIEVVSAGERDPDAEGVEGMSASKMRKAASESDFESFQQGLPSGFKDAKKLYLDVRKYMGIREEKDMGDMTDFETLRDLYLTGKIWNIDDLVEANGIEGRIVRRGTNYVTYNDSDGKVHKAWLHEITLNELPATFVSKLINKIDRATHPKGYEKLVKRYVDAMKKDKSTGRALQTAISGISNPPSLRSLQTYINNLVAKGTLPKELKADYDMQEIQKGLRRVKQDPDIKGDPGTEPAKYYKGVKKSVKPKRDDHFERGAKMDDDNPAAYTPAPGDKDKSGKLKKTKPSKHTLKFKKMFGEETMDLNEKIEGLVNKSKKSGVAYSILKQVYNRGMAAWRTGHRPGTTPQQWAFARVNSFLTGGGARKADADLWSKAKKSKASKKEGFASDAQRRAAFAQGYKAKGKKADKEQVQEWFESDDVRSNYELRYGNDWWWKLNEVHDAMLEKLGACCEDCAEEKKETRLVKFSEMNTLNVWGEVSEEAEYQGRKVKLNNPTRGDVKKFKVYVRNDKGNVVKVEYGDPNMEIKRDDPARRKSFRARHNCDNPGPKYKARYWSCKFWEKGKTVTDLMKG